LEETWPSPSKPVFQPAKKYFIQANESFYMKALKPVYLLFVLLILATQISAANLYSTDFEGSEPNWGCFTTNQNLDTCTTDASDEYTSPDESAKANRENGVCGIGGVSREYSFSTNPETLEMDLKAKANDWGSTAIYLEDSDGYHLLWEKYAGGSSYDTSWMQKSFDISSYDRDFKLIIGNDDNSPYCDNGDHTWWIWADDILIQGQGKPPNKPSEPKPANNSVVNAATSQTVSISAKYTDPDGQSGTLTYYELDTGNEIGSCSTSDGSRCSVDWSVSHRENWWYAVADDGGATTRSDNWMFVANQPPDKTTSPESPSSGSIIYSDSIDLSAKVSDPDGDNLEATFQHNNSFSNTTGPYTSGSTASVSLDNIDRGKTYKWWIDVSDTWNVTRSNEWTFYVNSLPNVYNADPTDVVTEKNPELSINATDDNSDTLQAYFFDDQGDYMGKDLFSSGDKANITYSNVDIGETYDWKVNVSDGFENITRVYSFKRTTTRNTRVDQRIEYRYSSVILSDSETRDIFFEIENQIEDSKVLKTYLSGPNATFAENNQDSITYSLPGNSKRQFIVSISPESTGTKLLNITTENQEIGVNTTATIPVDVKNYTEVSETSEVSGIGTIQLLMLLLVSAYLYSARL
jgi:hypothetical protein